MDEQRNEWDNRFLHRPNAYRNGYRFFLTLMAALAFSLVSLQATAGDTPVTVTLTITPNPIVAGRPATATVTVKPAGGALGTPTGTINISADESNCTITLPSTNCQFTVTDTGSVDVFVFYSGDANFESFGFSKTNNVVAGTSTALTSSPNPSDFGTQVTFVATVTGTNLTGKVTFKDGSSVLCNNVGLSAGKANCVSAGLSAGTHSITATYAGDANNGTSTSPAVTQTVKPGSVNFDQHGLTGTWYNPNTGGQGFLIEMYPDLVSAGTGLLVGSWFTFDVAPAGGAEKQRWYTFSGPGDSIHPSAQVDIFSTQGGNFDAPPQLSAVKVGQAQINLTDCSNGTFTYGFSDGSGRSNRIPITRLTPNVTCGNARDNGTPPGKYLLSGAWFEPSTGGQGFLFDVNPVQNYFAAAWYTFAPNGQAIGGPASERWYTLQAPLTAGNTISDIGIFTRTGGVFDSAAASTQSQVGTATLTFASCGAATLTYSFTGGSSAGSTGSIKLERVGPTPAGCSL